MSTKIQFTQEGFDKLLEEQKELREKGRQKAVTRLAKARAMGDLSENSEYSAAKEELAFVEGRIREVEELLKNAEIIDATKTSGVSIGSEIEIEKDGTIEIYTIVGEFEADPIAKKLSVTSPIGKALNGKNIGDTVFVDVPAGKLQYKILKIRS